MFHTPLRHVALTSLLVLSIQPAAVAQVGTDWTLRAPVHGPSNRFGAALAYDVATGQTILFGGQQSPNFFKDTWVWNGVDWRESVTAAPPARSFLAMAFDSDRKMVVMFGGRDRSGSKNDTWEYDGVRWTQRFPAVAPAPETGHSMVYDSARRRIVMFSGSTAIAATWEYDGVNWTQVVTAHSPPPRARHGMAFDSARQKTVLFGGRTDLADTWEYDGVDWVQRTSSNTPPGRSEHAMTYDAARGRVVINAGIHSSFSPNQLDDTWEWDGTDWVQRLPTTIPPRRDGHQMVFDARRRKVVMFGHGTDTWEYAPNDPASVTVDGAGCPGSLGTPSLSANAGSLPWMGDTLRIELGQVAANPAWTLFFGTSDSVWGPFSLPLDLTVAGMPGCSLATSVDIVQPAAGGFFALPIPVVAGLEGSHFYCQAVVSDPAINTAGLVLSNSLDVVIGVK